MTLTVGIIYKITYPNGKIYIGQDRTRDVNYFGSADSFSIAADFPLWCWDDFTITKTVLEHRADITIRDLNALEARYIAQYRSNDPAIGYNRTGQKRRMCRTLIKGE
jgi:hypothetical protein